MKQRVKMQSLVVVFSYLYNSEALCKNTAAISGKASRAGDTLACRTCDGEGGVSLSAKADARIGGRVLNEYRGLNRSCKTGEVVDVLGVHMCGVAEAVLCLNGKVDSLVNISYSYDRKNGHHKLVLNERMLKLGLADDAAHVVANVDTKLCKNYLSVSAYAVSAYGF